MSKYSIEHQRAFALSYLFIFLVLEDREKIVLKNRYLLLFFTKEPLVNCSGHAEYIPTLKYLNQPFTLQH